jgi:hypothetical protein
MALAFPTVRGRRYAHSSIEIAIVLPGGAAEVFVEVTDVSYDDTLEEELVYGTNPAPLGRTRGQYDPGEASMTMTKQSADVLIDRLGDGYMEQEINVVVKYSDVGLPVTTDTLELCRVVGLAQSSSSGPEAVMTEVKLKPLTVLRNGHTPLTDHLR